MKVRLLIISLAAAVFAAAGYFATTARNQTRICKEGKGERAISACTWVLQWGRCWHADMANVLISRGVAYKHLLQYPRAMRDFDLAIKLKPDDADALLNRGATNREMGDEVLATWDFNQAILVYSQAIKLRPDDAAALVERGNAYLTLGLFGPAIEDYEHAIGLRPHYAEAFLNRGRFHYYSTSSGRDLPRAIKDFDEAIRLKPGCAEAFFYRGSAYDDLDQHAEAIRDFDQAVKLNPDYVEAFYGRSLAKSQRGDIEGSRADLAVARKLDPTDHRFSD